MSGFLNLGELLYESDVIAFDTVSHLFTNPKAGTTYGPNVPAGGWAIPWYQDSAGQVQVPTGPAGVAQSAADAQALAQTVVSQLAAQGKTVTAPILAAVANPAPAVVAPGSTFISTIPSTGIDLAALWNKYWWVLLGGGALYMFNRGRG
jgi:hypothetical protein